ncbi:hypothetical protein RND71_021871 [Anisodus tanguticus]|uniref:Superoxide dismutase [Cu-Zn] n=1 Tax=Anisodus tanguticus TaxID=243964 RepID=A0AAE1RYZ7_9SOLA|nr:hypothetical protein RND71_021871 [Anisodus tanguticus]
MGRLKAVAVISGNNSVKGSLHLIQQPNGGTHVRGRIIGLTPGPHFNPLKKDHGAPTDEVRHAGDLGNIVAGPDGVAEILISDMQIPLSGVHSILGRAVVVHADPDDLGRGGHELSKTTGNAGARVGCGVIGLQSSV